MIHAVDAPRFAQFLRRFFENARLLRPPSRVVRAYEIGGHRGEVAQFPLQPLLDSRVLALGLEGMKEDRQDELLQEVLRRGGDASHWMHSMSEPCVTANS